MINKIKLFMKLFESKDFINFELRDYYYGLVKKRVVAFPIRGYGYYAPMKHLYINNSKWFNIKYARKKIKTIWTGLHLTEPKKLIIYYGKHIS